MKERPAVTPVGAFDLTGVRTQEMKRESYMDPYEEGNTEVATGREIGGTERDRESGKRRD